MCDEEIDFMVLSSQISNIVELERKINPVKYSLKMFIMMTLYNLLDLLKDSHLPHKELLGHNLLTETNQVFDILLMEGSINPLFDEEPQEIKEYSQEISQRVFTLFSVKSAICAFN
jgi:hypothetical protein